MIGMLITLLVFLIIAGLAWWLISLIPLPAEIVQVVFVVICALILISILLGGVSLPAHGVFWR